jgi:6-phosphogluconolactonase (cycloisomerase 2 family)
MSKLSADAFSLLRCRRGRVALALVVGCLAAMLAAVAGAGAAVYVSNNSQGTLSTFSVAAGGALTMLGSPSASGTSSASAPNQLAISPDGLYLYATNASQGTVSAFSIGTGGALMVVGTPVNTGTGAGSNPQGVATSIDDKHLYVANYGQGTVSAFAIGLAGALTAIGSPVTSGTSTASAPYSLIVSPSGRYLYVTNGNQSSISTFAIAADGSIAQVATSVATTVGIPSGIGETPDGRFLFATEDGGLGTVEPFGIGADGRPVADGGPVSTGTGPAYVAASPSGRQLYVSVQGPGDIATFDIAADGKLTAVGSPLHSGNTADGIAVSPNGHNVYMADHGDGTVAAFSLAADGSPSALGAPVISGTGSSSGSDGVAVAPDPGPTAAFTTSGNATRTFDASSSTPGSTPIASFAWSLGDGTSASGVSVTHTYAAPSNYTATLTVTGANGCSTFGPFAGQTAFCRLDPAASSSQLQSVVAVPVTGSPTPPGSLPPSAPFSIRSKRASRTGVLTLVAQTSQAGSLSANATYSVTIRRTVGHGRNRRTRVTHRTMSYGQASVLNRAAGTVKLTIRPNSRALRRLRAVRTLPVTIVVRFAPTLGAASSKTVHLTVTRGR